MPRLILHAGGPKTASSYLQVLLAVEAERLLADGIVVPETRESAAARSGKITSGNGLELANYLCPSLKHYGPAREDYPRKLGGILEAAQSRTVVLSSEFIDFPQPDRGEAIRRVAERFGYSVEFVFYVRDLSSAAYSFYSQSVKRHNDTRSFEAFLENWRPPYLSRIHNAAAVLPKKAIRVFNYDALCGEIKHHFFAEVLGVTPPDKEDRIVNRSLTFAELNILRRMNARFPANNRYSTFVSDAVLYGRPDVDSHGFRLTPAEADLLRAKHTDHVNRLNEWLPDQPVAVIGAGTEIGTREEPALTDFEEIMLAVLTSLVKAHVAQLVEQARKKAAKPAAKA